LGIFTIVFQEGGAITANSANAAAPPSTFLMPQHWKITNSKVVGTDIIQEGRRGWGKWEKGGEAEMVFVLRLISGLIYRHIWEPEKTFPPEHFFWP
jgi:hypothetical protein